jgi:hypothetical protein
VFPHGLVAVEGGLDSAGRRCWRLLLIAWSALRICSIDSAAFRDCHDLVFLFDMAHIDGYL